MTEPRWSKQRGLERCDYVGDKSTSWTGSWPIIPRRMRVGVEIYNHRYGGTDRRWVVKPYVLVDLGKSERVPPNVPKPQ